MLTGVAIETCPASLQQLPALGMGKALPWHPKQKGQSSAQLVGAVPIGLGIPSVTQLGCTHWCCHWAGRAGRAGWIED